MAFVAHLARPYAKALFQMASESNTLAAWSEGFETLQTALQDKTVILFLKSPRWSFSEKAVFLSELLSETIQATAYKWFLLICKNKRQAALPLMMTEFEALKREALKEVLVKVSSVVPLSETVKGDIKQKLQKRFAKAIVLEESKVSTLLGGMVLTANNTVIDGSIRGRLKLMAESIKRETR